MKMVPNEEYFVGKSVVIVGPSQSLKGRSKASSLTLSTLLFVSTKVGGCYGL